MRGQLVVQQVGDVHVDQLPAGPALQRGLQHWRLHLEHRLTFPVMSIQLCHARIRVTLEELGARSTTTTNLRGRSAEFP